MTRTNRVLEVLSLFSEFKSNLSAQDIAQHMGIARATAYRCIHDLEARGLLESSGNGEYVLGPTIVELDRRIRLADPLIRAAAPIMGPLSVQTGGMVLLCRVHGRKVLCVHECPGAHGPLSVSYERGRAMPLYRGATSRAILANLSVKELLTLAKIDPEGMVQAGLPEQPDALLEWAAEQRQYKVWHSQGEVDPGAAGWAVALHHGKQLLGSLSVVLSRDHIGSRGAAISDQVLRAGLRIEGRLEARSLLSNRTSST